MLTIRLKYNDGTDRLESTDGVFWNRETKELSDDDGVIVKLEKGEAAFVMNELGNTVAIYRG